MQNEYFYKIWYFFDKRKSKNCGLTRITFSFSIVKLSDAQ